MGAAAKGAQPAGGAGPGGCRTEGFRHIPASFRVRFYADPVSDGSGMPPAANPLDRRRPRSVYGVGGEPDPRFSMANERTALAWVRTGLAFVAGGIALTSVSAVTALPTWLDIAAVFSCLIGGATAINAVVSWRRSERAMRKGERLPSPTVLPWLVGAVVVAALVIAGFALGQA